MTRPPQMPGHPRSEEDIARELRLRPDPPRVMRLSRRAIALATAVGGLGLGASPNTGAANDPVWSRETFRMQTGDTETVSAERITAPPSPYILQAGTVIPAALITGLRSDLPGQISAQVTSNVYDSPSGRYLLIPQGARLLGEVR